MTKKKALNVRRKKPQRSTQKRDRRKKRPTPSPRDRTWNLSTLPSVRRHLAAICTDLSENRYRSVIGLSRARTMIYGLSTVAGILKAELELELEREVITRLAVLERKMEGV